MKDYKPFQSSDLPVSEDALFHQYIDEIKEYAIFLMNPQGHIITWNKGARHIKGYNAKEIVGQHYRILFPEDKQQNQSPEQELEHAITHGRFEDESWRRRKGGEIFWANIVLTAIYNEEGEVKCLIKITRDLTERKKAEDALYKRNEKLIKLNAELDNFVYTASHDLKSPLLNIAGLIDALDQETDPEKHSRIKNYIRVSVSRLQKTINELADIARVNKNLEEGNAEVVLFDEILEDVRYSITNKMRDDCPDIETDFQLKEIVFSRLNLKSIMFNLVTNAIKYRSPGGECYVKVSSYKENDNCVLEVKDKGVGMPKGYQEKVFKMFTRLHYHVDGSGVGLYIIKRIVDNAGGKIEVDSEESKGTTFRVFLPAGENGTND